MIKFLYKNNYLCETLQQDNDIISLLEDSAGDVYQITSFEAFQKYVSKDHPNTPAGTFYFNDIETFQEIEADNTVFIILTEHNYNRINYILTIFNDNTIEWYDADGNLISDVPNEISDLFDRALSNDIEDVATAPDSNVTSRKLKFNGRQFTDAETGEVVNDSSFDTSTDSNDDATLQAPKVFNNGKRVVLPEGITLMKLHGNDYRIIDIDSNNPIQRNQGSTKDLKSILSRYTYNIVEISPKILDVNRVTYILPNTVKRAIANLNFDNYTKITVQLKDAFKKGAINTNCVTWIDKE